MQNLEVISVNLWNTLISLLNLVILYFIVRYFLFKPVTKIMEKRQKEIDDKYAIADNAVNDAQSNKKLWEEKIKSAQTEAYEIIKNASETAKIRGEAIISDAQQEANSIIKSAQNEAMLERKKASDDIKREIIDLSSVLSEKILEREINKDDHENLINSFIEKIGENNE